MRQGSVDIHSNVRIRRDTDSSIVPILDGAEYEHVIRAKRAFAPCVVVLVRRICSDYIDGSWATAAGYVAFKAEEVVHYHR